MTQPLKGRIAKPDAVMVREIGGESVLLNLGTESYFGLDEVGTRMWSALNESPSIEAAFERLLEEFDVAPEELREDLNAFVLALAEAKLIAVNDA